MGTAPVNLAFPAIIERQTGFFLVGQAEVPMFDAIDQQFGDAEEGGFRIRTGLGDQRGEFAGFLECPDGKLAGIETLR